MSSRVRTLVYDMITLAIQKIIVGVHHGKSSWLLLHCHKSLSCSATSNTVSPPRAIPALTQHAVFIHFFLAGSHPCWKSSGIISHVLVFIFHIRLRPRCFTLGCPRLRRSSFCARVWIFSPLSVVCELHSYDAGNETFSLPLAKHGLTLSAAGENIDSR